MAMLSAKKLVKRKWISFPRNGSDTDSCSTSSSFVVEKGHFVVYTADQSRFVVPLAYLENEVIRQLLSMSEEQFGLPSSGPITLPCDSTFMDYIMSLIKKGVAVEDLHKACSSQFLHVAVQLLLRTKKVEFNRFLFIEFKINNCFVHASQN